MPGALVIHGPNMNLLGSREPHLYGRRTLEEVNALMEKWAREKGWDVTMVQCNSEGEILEAIHGAPGKHDLLVINPAAFTHYSLALADGIRSVGIPAIEVHLTNIFAREENRRISVTASACSGMICGFGPWSYILALEAGERLLSGENTGIL
jgi:3-dehydroquinate dehydratase-2